MEAAVAPVLSDLDWILSCLSWWKRCFRSSPGRLEQTFTVRYIPIGSQNFHVSSQLHYNSCPSEVRILSQKVRGTSATQNFNLQVWQVAIAINQLAIYASAT